MWEIVGAWLAHPRRTGTILPSSRRLARAMAREALKGAPRTILEVGAGSGAVTHALLNELQAGQRLLLVDINARLLARTPNGPDRIHADAGRLPVRHADVIVCSLPLTSMRPEAAAEIVSHLREVAPRIVLYQYSRARLSLVQRFFPSARIVERVYANVPPANVIASGP